jgi:hypothetical protein
MMKKIAIVVGAMLALVLLVRLVLPERHVAYAGNSPQAAAAVPAEELDRLLAPVALYRTSSSDKFDLRAESGQVDALHLWLGKNPTLKGTELQDAVSKRGSSRASSHCRCSRRW